MVLFVDFLKLRIYGVLGEFRISKHFRPINFFFTHLQPDEKLKLIKFLTFYSNKENSLKFKTMNLYT
jgi:hypothetical protein